MKRLAIVFFLLSGAARADGPLDNIPEKARRVPPPGKKLEPGDRAELLAGTRSLATEIAQLRTALKGKLVDLLTDVEIFHDAVHSALVHDEFFKDYDKSGKHPEVEAARKLLKMGLERANSLRQGKHPWTSQTGLVVRGYRSKIDDSVQPYGLVVPESFVGSAYPHRLDIWFHGRGEILSELNFLDDRLRNPGQFTPRHAFVLHPYGRYCNANHFAGEVDTFEALEHVQKNYTIDDNRIVVRGFSMGGAACWHFAVHHAWRWAAAAPGAGFSETPDFLRVFQSEDYRPPWYEKYMLHWYDCTDWVTNLMHCPTVAYSGTKDKQKQAADVMEAAMKAERLSLVHVLGPGTGHSYHAAAKTEIDRRIDSIAAKGRDPFPRHIQFTTWTLSYPRMHWVTVQGLSRHWEMARVDARLGKNAIQVRSENVDALTLDVPPGYCPFDPKQPVAVHFDEAEKGIECPNALSDRSWKAHFRKKDGVWHRVDSLDDGTLRKRPGLQGPIDDAFMDRFLMVRPTGKSSSSKVNKWVADEMAHAIEHWRRQFRGQARIKNDSDVNDEDIRTSNLILWGDPSSNRLLAKIVGKLPITWSDTKLTMEKNHDAAHHVPAMIYPNPLNPSKYVVLNSGFTFREYDYLNNARQVPKLPDWAVLDIDEPATSQRPAGIVSAGFFDEHWKWTKEPRTK